MFYFRTPLFVKRSFAFFAFFLLSLVAAAQQLLTGTVTDSKTGEPVPFANVYYEDRTGVQTDADGKFALTWRQGKLFVSIVGYEAKSFQIKSVTQLDVRLRPLENVFSTAVVQGTKKKKYSRKDNPAVELMRKVIAAKKKSDLHQRDFFSIDKYSKLVFALNDVKRETFVDGPLKKYPFLAEQVEVNNLTGKLILPISVEETVSQEIWRKSTGTEKSIITGKRSNGINDVFNTGDILNTMLKDCFTDVDIYEDHVRLLQYPFLSPIATNGAISFYRYFLGDTLQVGTDRCIEVTFTPNNPQDFGFSGSLYVMADSTYRVRRIEMGIPKRSDVNFVNDMRIEQDFRQLPSGEQVLYRDDMLVQITVAKFLQDFQVKRTTEYSKFDFGIVPEKVFKFQGKERMEANAMMRDEEFWESHRADALTTSEGQMNTFVRNLQNIKGFKWAIFVAKAFVENFVETSLDPKHPSKVDIGPVNTMISQNQVDGFRLRASAQTTANLDPHWFLKGYVAYGFRDHRWKGMGEVTYSFNKKAYLPREFPVNNLTFTYQNDVMSPVDKFMPTDKDNVFTSFKWTTVDHMQYSESFRLLWDREWGSGLRLQLSAKHEKTEPTAALFYQRLNGTGPSADVADHLQYLRTTELGFGIIYQPGVTWINTKQRRLEANLDAPRLSFTYTAGLKGVLGADYTFHFTEASLYKRIWLGSWGKMDTQIKAGAQWSKVPFPLLIMPAANLSYIKEDFTFSLIDNMEFLNDRYASLMWSWDLNGKIFNRVPLLKRLKWREYIGVNALWGYLTEKNNPFVRTDDASLFYFPGRYAADGSYHYLSTVMDWKKPYVEAIVGIHNIFKIIHVEYVRRLTYLDKSETKKWGIRFMFRVTF